MPTQTTWDEVSKDLVGVVPVLDRLSTMPITPDREEALFNIDPDLIRKSAVKLRDHIQGAASASDHPEKFLTMTFAGIIDEKEINPDHPLVDFFNHYGHRTTTDNHGAVAHLADAVFQTIGTVHAGLKKTVETWKSTGRESLIRTVEQVGLYVNVLEVNIEGFAERRTRDSNFGTKSGQLVVK